MIYNDAPLFASPTEIWVLSLMFARCTPSLAEIFFSFFLLCKMEQFQADRRVKRNMSSVIVMNLFPINCGVDVPFFPRVTKTISSPQSYFTGLDYWRISVLRSPELKEHGIKRLDGSLFSLWASDGCGFIYRNRFSRKKRSCQVPTVSTLRPVLSALRSVLPHIEHPLQ